MLLNCDAEPHTGFHIAFKMLDIDGNEHVDKKEFLKVCLVVECYQVRGLLSEYWIHVLC